MMTLQEKSTIEVSVIMPTFNCLMYLPQAVNSVLSQDVSLELLIVDDGSTDGSDVWLQEQAAMDSRIVIIKGNHAGVSAARNLAIKQAKGSWVAFLDADDYWYANKLRMQLEALEEAQNCVLSFTEYDHFDEQGGDLGGCFQFWPRFTALFHKLDKAARLQPNSNISGKNNHSDSAFTLRGEAKACIYEENVIGTSTVMVRADILRRVSGFDESLFSASDWDLWLKISAFGGLSVVRKSTTGYLVRQNSISRNQEKRLHSVQFILERYRAPMELLNPNCFAPAFARFKLAQAEAYQNQPGGYLRAIFAYLQACYQIPSKRNMRACLSHIIYGLWRQT